MINTCKNVYLKLSSKNLSVLGVMTSILYRKGEKMAIKIGQFYITRNNPRELLKRNAELKKRIERALKYINSFRHAVPEYILLEILSVEDAKKIANYDKLLEKCKWLKSENLAKDGIIKDKNKTIEQLRKQYKELQAKYDAIVSPSEQMRMELDR